MGVVLKVLKWTLLACLLVVLAWVAFNNPLADTAPRARPVELAQAPPTDLPPERNAFLTIQKIADSPLPKEPPWQCGPGQAGCDEAAWLEQAPLLRQHLREREAPVVQCESLVGDASFAFEEPALQFLPGNAAATPMPQLSPFNRCLQWFRARASVALADGDIAAMHRALALADKLSRTMLEHSRSLLAHAIGWAGARRNWQFAAAMAAKRPDLVPQLQQTVLRPLSAAALSPQRWIASESAFNAAVTAETVQGCGSSDAFAAAARGFGDLLWCATGLGLLPNRTQQLFDQRWLEVLTAGRQGPAGLQNSFLRAAEDPGWTLLAWRNTIGQLLFDVAWPGYRSYLARQFDVELSRQVTVLALQMDAAHVPAPQRAAWLQSQTIDPLLRDRLSFEGDTLVARPWRAESEETLAPRDQIRVPLAH